MTSATWGEVWSGPACARLVHCDAAQATRETLGLASSKGVDLVYMDPPYLAGREFGMELTWEDADGAPASRTVPIWSDRWPDREDYFAMLEGAFRAAHALLHEEGSLLVHLDPKVAPRASILLDAIFGDGERFARGDRPGYRNELVWSYGLGGSSPRTWPRKHDTIYWYTRGARWYFEAPRVPARSQRMKGQTKKATDVIEVASLNNMARERTGFPTQKPSALLSMLIGAHAPAGGHVVDLFVGSGTTAACALALGCEVTGADASPDALRASRARLVQAGWGVRMRVDGAARPHPLDMGHLQKAMDGSLRWFGQAPPQIVAWGRVEEGVFMAEYGGAVDGAPAGPDGGWCAGGDAGSEGRLVFVRDAAGNEFIGAPSSG